MTYCWWKKSCTTWDTKNPVKNGCILHINWLAGFLPSTVFIWYLHIHIYVYIHLYIFTYIPIDVELQATTWGPLKDYGPVIFVATQDCRVHEESVSYLIGVQSFDVFWCVCSNSNVCVFWVCFCLPFQWWSFFVLKKPQFQLAQRRFYIQVPLFVCSKMYLINTCHVLSIPLIHWSNISNYCSFVCHLQTLSSYAKSQPLRRYHPHWNCKYYESKLYHKLHYGGMEGISDLVDPMIKIM